nr:hypothetical protein [Tanacetum cinerariifolium]
MDQLEKQLDNKEFLEIGSMPAFKVLETQFQMFIKSRIYLDDEYVVMTRNYFLQYTQLEILEFRDTLIHHMESVKKSIDKRSLHKREYAAGGTESGKHDTSSSSGNDVDADEADIKPVYDEMPMAEVQLTAEINVFATGQQHTEQPKFNNEGKVDQNAEQCRDTLTTHYLSREGESAFAKPNHMIAPSSSRYYLKWKPTGKIFKTVGLKWVPTGKIFTSSTTKVDSKPPNVQMRISPTHINANKLLMSVQGIKEYKYDKQAMTSDHNSSELRIHDHNNEPSSSKLVPKVVPPADKTATSRQELEFLFHHQITMLRLQLGHERQRRVHVSVHLSLALEKKFSNMMFFKTLHTIFQEFLTDGS